MSAQIYDIFRKPQYDETTQKIEQRTFHPYVKSFENSDVIEITINQLDCWLNMFNAALIIEGSLTVAANSTGKVQFINNAGPFMFENITYEINGKEIETVRDPGIVSTIRGYLCYNSTDNMHLDIASWNYPLHAISNPSNGLFMFRIPLGHLFNIFNDYKCVQYGRQTIRLVRARSDADCYRIEEDATVAVAKQSTTVELKIDSVSLEVPLVYPNDLIKLSLLEAIKKDKPILIPFRLWQLYELPQLTPNSKKEIWNVRVCDQNDKPVYIVVAVQTKLRNNEGKDPTAFHNCNIRDVAAVMCGEYIPTERLKLDFKNNIFHQAFFNYTEFKPSYKNDMNSPKDNILNFITFKNHSLFVIDCSKRSPLMKSTTVDVKIIIESTEPFPADTKVYCILISEVVMEQLPLSEIVRKIS